MNAKSMMQAILCLHPDLLALFRKLQSEDRLQDLRKELKKHHSNTELPDKPAGSLRAFRFETEDGKCRIQIDWWDQVWLADHFFLFYLHRASKQSPNEETCPLCYRTSLERTEKKGCVCERPKSRPASLKRLQDHAIRLLEYKDRNLEKRL